MQAGGNGLLAALAIVPFPTKEQRQEVHRNRVGRSCEYVYLVGHVADRLVLVTRPANDVYRVDKLLGHVQAWVCAAAHLEPLAGRFHHGATDNLDLGAGVNKEVYHQAVIAVGGIHHRRLNALAAINR